MPFLEERDRREIQRLFEQFDRDVNLVFFTKRQSPLYVPGVEECETCEDAQMLLEEVAALSEKLHLEVHDLAGDSALAKEYGIGRIPALIISSELVKGKPRFFGMPAGYEFSTIINTVLDASKGVTAFGAATKETVAAIDKDVHIQVFVTPT